MSTELSGTGNILIYQNEKGDTKIDVYFVEDTIWMTQKAMCELYQVAKSSVSEHISNIYKDGELDQESTVRKFRTVQTEGNRQVGREEEKLGQFLQFNGQEVLQGFGSMSREAAEKLAVTEYEKYDAHRRAMEAADVDALTEGVKRLKPR